MMLALIQAVEDNDDGLDVNLGAVVIVLIVLILILFAIYLIQRIR